MAQILLEARSTAARGWDINHRTALRLAALTPAALLIHGYHPFADDAGIYVAGIRKLLNPSLYRPDGAFVLASTHFSVFAYVLAGVVRITHLPLTVVLLAAHLTSIYLFLLAAWSVAKRVFTQEAERWLAVVLAAACLTLPAAGTALVLMDPYVTPRSFSTPLGLFAVAAVLDRRWTWAAVLVVVMGLVHPLMAIYTAALAVLYVLVDARRVQAAIGFGAAGVALAGMIAAAARHASVSPAYFEAVHSRVRMFLYPAEWRWYEDFGLAAPLALFALAGYWSKAESRIHKLCLACVLLGVSSALAAVLFVRSSGPYFLVRLQLLRSFHVLYLLGVVLLGGWLAKVLTRRQGTRWLAFVLPAIAAGGMFAAQRATYPFSAHIEWPGMQPRNLWAQAYDWIRGNTSGDAAFAADPTLAFREGADMQGFRATTERSLLADDKDQGVVAVVDPALAGEWAAQRDAQLDLNRMSDAERESRLRPFGVTWLLLEAKAMTNFPCPYQNAVAKVCRLE